MFHDSLLPTNKQSMIKEPTDLTIVSWNILHWLKNSKAATFKTQWNKRRDGVMAALQNIRPDIAGIQEATSEQWPDFKNKHPEYSIADKSMNMKKWSSTMVLYRKDRVEYIDGGLFYLSETPHVFSKGFGTYTEKTCTWCIFRDLRNANKFLFLNAHFVKSGCTNSEKARKKSAELILKKAKELASGLPIVFVGDLNTEPNEPPHKILSKSLQDSRSTAETYYNGKNNVNTFIGTFKASKQGRKAILDHIFASHNFRVKRYVVHVKVNEKGRDIYCSDHRPVKVILGWKI